MIILRPGDDDVARIAALMLNFEHGALVRGANGEELPPPHKPFPIVELSSITDDGLPTTIHYKPTVGVIFYTAARGFNVETLAEELSNHLEAAGDDHLRGYRTVAATPSTVMRHKARVVGGHVLKGPRACYRNSRTTTDPLPSRLFNWVPPDANGMLPLHYSIRAAFTWVFMPITHAIKVERFNTMSQVNAMMSSILYDAGNICIHEDHTEIRKVKDSDFVCYDPPQTLARVWHRCGTMLNSTSAVLIVDPAVGVMEISGTSSTLFGTRASQTALSHNSPTERVPWTSQQGEPLKFEPWEGINLHEEDGAHTCVFCEIPASDNMVVIRGGIVPAAGVHREWEFNQLNPGEPLFSPGDHEKGRLLCCRCWNSLSSSSCITTHLNAQLSYTTVPMNQARAFADHPRYSAIGRLLEGTIRPSEINGAFILTIDGEEAVLCAKKLGNYPRLTCPGISELQLPVLSRLRIAEIIRD